MMRNKIVYTARYLLLILFMLWFTMCQSNKKKGFEINRSFKSDSLIEINIDNLETKQPIYFSQLFKGLKIVPLETSDKCLIGNISQIEKYNDIYYILDSNNAKALLLFDNSGKFIKKIGTIGKGPGEYISPHMFSIDQKRKQIQILDTKQNKIIIYSNNGNFMREIKLNIHFDSFKFVIHNDITYIDILSSRFAKSDFLLYSLNGITGKIISRWFPTQAYTKGFDQPFNVSKNNFFKTENDIKYSKTFFDTIFSVKGNIVKPYIAITSKNKISPEIIHKMNNYKRLNELSHYLNFECDKFQGVSNYIESSGLLMFNFKNKLRNHHLFYWRETKEVYCTNKFIDDLTYVTFHSGFYATCENNYISYISSDIPGRMEKFIEDIKHNNIKTTKKELATLGKLSLNSNPVILLYECREKMNTNLKTISIY